MEKFIGFAVLIGMVAVIIAAASGSGFSFLEPRANPPGATFFSFSDSAYTPTPSPRSVSRVREQAPSRSPSTQPSLQESFEERISRIRTSLVLQKAQARETDPQKEYLDLVYRSSLIGENPLPLDMTGWTVENPRGDRFGFGYVANLPYAGQVNTLSRLIVPPESTVHIITGRSPIGANFRTNRCTGYFDQFDSYTPPLPHKCPRPSQEPAQSHLPDACLDYIETLPRCRIPQNTLLDIGNACRAYITNTISYSGCVAHHKIDPDFYGNEWYVYLNRPSELWKEKREKIILRDQQGNLMAELEY